MIVLDASAAVLALLNDGEARRSVADASVAVPHLADSEVAHALDTLVLRGLLPPDQAREALGLWARLGVRRFPAVGLLPRIWELRLRRHLRRPGRSPRVRPRHRRRPARPGARADLPDHRGPAMTRGPGESEPVPAPVT